MLQKKKGILFIGLVNFKKETGDAVHFKKLTNYLLEEYNGKFITLTSGKSNNNHKKIKFPSNRIYRLLYWNINIFIHSFLILIKDKNIKCIYFRESGLVISPFFLKFFFRRKFILEVNGVNIDDLGLPKLITKPIFKLLYRIPSLITASKGYVKLLHQEFLVPFERFIIVQLGYDRYKVLPREECIDDINLNKDNRYILFIGNITAYQGLQNVIPSLDVILNSNPDTYLLIVGDGYYLNEVIKLVEKNNIKDKTIFVPRVTKEIIRYYVSCSEIGLSPFSFNRGIKGSISGLKTFDYLFGRLPIVTSEMDDMSEIIMKNNWGEVIKESDNLEIIQKRIQNVLENNQKYRDGIANQIDFIYNHFSWEKRFAKILEELNKIL